MNDDTLKALDEIEAALLSMLSAEVEYNEGIPCGFGPPANSALDMAIMARDALPFVSTLRAALTPVADDVVREIEARHKSVDNDLPEMWDPPIYYNDEAGKAAHADRATLLDRDARHVAEIARLSAELAAERKRRVEVEGALKPFAELMVNDYQSNSAESYQSWLKVLIACFETEPPATRAALGEQP